MIVKSDLVRVLGRLGGYSVAKALSRSEPKILMYHRFSEVPRQGRCQQQVFRRQVQHIKRHYRPISLIELATLIKNGAAVPANSIILTIDDGYRDFFDIAYPVLRQEEVPATYFVTTGFINRDLWLWTDQVAWLLNQGFSLSEKVRLESFELPAGDYADQKLQLFQKWLSEFLLSVPDEVKHSCIEKLSKILGRRLPEESPPEYSAVTWAQLEEMQDKGIEVGGHTVTHPSLGRVDYAQAEREIFGCMKDLSRNLGDRPRTFCYPNGMPSDFQAFLPKLVSEAGFQGACVAFSDSLSCSDRFAMRRHSSGNNWFQFEKAVSGLEYLGHRFRRSVKIQPESRIQSVGTN